jgi:steroid 5-alpha reductase family enzyme
MFDLNAYLSGLGIMLLLGVATWMVSVPKRDVSIVDSMWSIFFLAGALVYLWTTPGSNARDLLIVTLVSIWALRLAGYLTWRNWGEPEDHRYRKIRANNEPNFAFKSLYLVFALQALLAWIVSLPLLAALASDRPLGWLDVAGVALWAFGFLFETIADWQLARFKRKAINRGRVLSTGLWRYTRHPNYFGEFCVWWGFYLMALAAGGWWAIVAPLAMSFLLLKVSGVAMLEKDIGARRPAYRDYIARTNAFFPWFPRNATAARQAASQH